MTKPITPREALKSTATQIPEVIFDVFNEFLSDRARAGKSIRIGQDEVEAALVAKGWSKEEVSEAFERGWLDVEPQYEKAGWSVAFDKRAYNEDGEDSWTFKAKGRSR